MDTLEGKKKVENNDFGYTLGGMRTNNRKKYGRRAPGKTQTTISLTDEVYNKARAAAEADGRSLSNYLEQLLKRDVEGPGIYERIPVPADPRLNESGE